MALQTVLVANRGEIAIRIVRAAAELGSRPSPCTPTTTRRRCTRAPADDSCALGGSGAAAYLDIERVVDGRRTAAATRSIPATASCRENAAFARRCAEARHHLRRAVARGARRCSATRPRARALADDSACRSCGARPAAITRRRGDARFMSLASAAPIMLKAVAGGGGRGMRVVDDVADLPSRLRALPVGGARRVRRRRRSTSSSCCAARAPRRGADRRRRQRRGRATSGSASAACSGATRRSSRSRPRPGLPAGAARARCSPRRCGWRPRRATATSARSSSSSTRDTGATTFYFIEANPRLQVEHTVTEEVTRRRPRAGPARARRRALPRRARPGAGARAGAARLRHAVPREHGDDGRRRHGASRLAACSTAFEAPSGPGVRIDTFGYVGYRRAALRLAAREGDRAHAVAATFADALPKARRALAEFRVEGVATNIAFLQALLDHPDVARGSRPHRASSTTTSPSSSPRRPTSRVLHVATTTERHARAPGWRAQGRRRDPLAVLDYGKSGAARPTVTRAARAVAAELDGPAGTTAVRAPPAGHDRRHRRRRRRPRRRPASSCSSWKR